MKPSARPAPKDTAIAAGVGAGCALFMAILLASLGAPASLKERTAAVETNAAQAERLFRPGRNAATFGPDAICTVAPEAQAQALRASLTAFAGQGGVQIKGVDARPLGEDVSQRGLVAVRVRFEATGSYDTVVMLLDNLSRQKPEVFVDAVDLVAKASDVTLIFSGRVFCSA